MVNVNTVFAGNSFTSEGLGEDRPILTIAAAEVKEIVDQNTGKRQTKIIISFEEDPKQFWCNKINSMRISKRFGYETDDWVGKKIQLYVDHEVEFGGKFVDGIRVNVPRPATIPKPKSEFSDEVPF